MNKQQLSEALAWYADMTYLDEKDAPMVAAARLVERLLPGECDCDRGRVPIGEGYTDICPVCHGSGRVWDEGIVEAVKAQVGNTDHWEFDSGFGCWTEPSVDAITLAVLSALVELLTEKAGVADRPVLDSIEGVDPSEYSIELHTNDLPKAGSQ